MYIAYIRLTCNILLFEIEEDCKKLNFDRLSIFRPGLLGRGQDARFLEKAVGM